MTFNHAWVTPPTLIKETAEDGKRYYTTPMGMAYESVTTFISRNWDKSGLIKWKKDVGEAEAKRISNSATRRGTSLHNVLEAYLRNEELDFKEDPTTKDLFYKVKPIVDRLNNIRVLETPLYSDKLELAGTPDCIADYLGELAVADFKTATKPKEKQWIVDYFIQCACYAEMYNEHYNEMPTKAVIIMGVPDLPYGIVHTHPMKDCIKMLHNFRKDPIAFQKKIK